MPPLQSDHTAHISSWSGWILERPTLEPGSRAEPDVIMSVTVFVVFSSVRQPQITCAGEVVLRPDCPYDMIGIRMSPPVMSDSGEGRGREQQSPSGWSPRRRHHSSGRHHTQADDAVASRPIYGPGSLGGGCGALCRAAGVLLMAGFNG